MFHTEKEPFSLIELFFHFFLHESRTAPVFAEDRRDGSRALRLLLKLQSDFVVKNKLRMRF